MTSRFINDTIYSHIEYTKLEGKILQTKILSRLQFITQNALAYFAFPSINTKRYIHSLGTMHLASHMYKGALLNAKSDVRSLFFKELYKAVIKIESELSLQNKIKKCSLFEDDTLYQFLIPLKNSKEKYAYLISLQALRLVALLHDVGHLPFSHQSEYAMQSLYERLSLLKEPNKEEQKFLAFYEKLTDKNSHVLHEAMGVEFAKMLLTYEILQDFTADHDREYIALIYRVVDYILQDAEFGGFDFSVLHSFIDATVDADRLDYINRDMLASGYIGGAVDLLRIAKQSVLSLKERKYKVTFFDSAILDIEHMLEMRFNLYKKVIFNHEIAKKDAMLENLILYLTAEHFVKRTKSKRNDISMLWSFLDAPSNQKRLDTISLLDENWLISLFKKEYFSLKYSKVKEKQKMLMIYEEVLFGKKYFYSLWKNLNDFYDVLGFNMTQKYQFRESFGYISEARLFILKNSLQNFVTHYENKNNTAFAYQIVSFNLGISKDFSLYNGKNLIPVDEVSTLRKRLKKSMLNTVPFFLYCNKKELTKQMIESLREILIFVFEKNTEWRAQDDA
ncbi:hypothetical protein [Sulfurimonas sp.]|uniref:hypothetical protein n=1 Tax=Sulfurimonas sp. TaxID=2022749 RepID=UPI002A366CB7|nr:hypothetical protein [Sulfurimonas sp.]MDY0122715.1 hypothetical protein [Sulfurimonas sp.]